MKEKKIKVLFIGGSGRSGSTLLELILNQIDGIFSAGELIFFWERGVNQNQLCGCGRNFFDCELWSHVTNEVIRDTKGLCSYEVESLWKSIRKMRYIPQTVFPLKTKKVEIRLQKFYETLNTLFQSIYNTTGANIIVDSSKHSAYGFLLNNLQNIELYVVHLVRDSRAVTYSWKRKKFRPEIYWKKEYMPVYKPFDSALWWNIENLLLSFLKYFCKHYVLIRYEDLVENPQKVLTSILAELDIPVTSLDFLQKHNIAVNQNHTVSGNPLRLQQSAIRIQPDIEWQNKMTNREKSLINALTWPFLLRYGYFKKPR